MLERMYLRWAERSGMKTDVLERSANDDGGLKTVVLEISGPFAYGKLRSENGVHRLVRLSRYLIICARLTLHWLRCCQKLIHQTKWILTRVI